MAEIIYKTGDSVGKIISQNAEAVEPTPQPEPAPTPASVITPEPAPVQSAQPAESAAVATPEPTPTVVPEPEKNVSKFNIVFDEPAAQEPAAAQQPTFNIDEEIKKVDAKELLKKLGVSDFAIEMDTHIKNGGKAEDYLSAKAIDYNQVTDDALLKNDLRKQYPTLSPSQIDLMFSRKYNVAEDAGEEDKEFFLAQKQADAYKVRQSAIAEQQRFKIQEKPVQQPDNTLQEREQKIAQQAEAQRKWFNEHEATKHLVTSKRVALNLGDDGQFNFEVSQPDFIVKAMTDNGEIWGKLTSTKTGEPDVVKMQKIILYAANPDQFERDLVNYGKTLKLPELVDEARNITKPANVVPMSPENKGQPQSYKSGKVGG